MQPRRLRRFAKRETGTQTPSSMGVPVRKGLWPMAATRRAGVRKRVGRANRPMNRNYGYGVRKYFCCIRLFWNVGRNWNRRGMTHRQSGTGRRLVCETVQLCIEGRWKETNNTILFPFRSFGSQAPFA
jgi:hypothetical protein